jgi:hypothetical protein
MEFKMGLCMGKYLARHICPRYQKPADSKVEKALVETAYGQRFFIRKSGLIHSFDAAEITYHLQKFGIKPDGINRTGGPQFPIERASAKQSGAKDSTGLVPRRLIFPASNVLSPRCAYTVL